MKRFLLQICAFIFFTVFILTVSGSLTNFLLSERNKDIHTIPPGKDYVILGNSRPALAFNDSLITRVYNFSSIGEAYFYTYLKAEQIIKNNKHLKGIFLEYNLEDIGHKRDSWTWGRDFMQNNYVKYSYAMSFYNFKTLMLKNPKDWFAVHMGQAFVRQMKNILILDKGELQKYYGGYFFDNVSNMDSLLKEVSVSQKDHIKNVAEFHQEQLRRILKLCRENGIKVYLIRSPLHYSNGIQPDRNWMLSYLGPENKDLEYLDFNDYPADLEEYKDPSHLNDKGAIRFSRFFNQLIEDGLLSEQNMSEFLRMEIRNAVHEASYKNMKPGYAQSPTSIRQEVLIPGLASNSR